MSQLDESDGATPADGHGDGDKELALSDTGLGQFQYPAPTWLLDNEKFPAVAEQCLLSVLLALPPSPALSDLLISLLSCSSPHPQEVRNILLVLGKLPSLNTAIFFFLSGTCCILILLLQST